MIFGRKPAPRPMAPPPLTQARTAVVAPPSGVAQNEAINQTREIEKVGPRTISDYSALNLVRVLSGGDRAEVQLTSAQREFIAVIECSSPSGAMIVVDREHVDQSEIQSIRGTLHSLALTVLPATLVTAGLIGQIYQSVGRDVDGKGMRRTHNPYLPAIHEWINYAIENRATDIHIEIKGVTGKVRFRVDGELEIMRTSGEGQYPSSFLQSCMSTLYNNEQQRNSGSDALFDPGTMVYCMVPYDEIKGHKLKLRYQSLKGSEGPKVVLRLLNADDSAPTLTFEQLGYEKSQINLWRQAMQTPSGTCVIAGITGSGKSTTQKSFIELNPDLPSMCVFTLEDPIEYPLKNVHQIHLQRNLTNEAESAMKFNEAITAIMRADPDAVMVGEVRDVDSANALIQIAESGHFAMATTHTHLMSGIVPRLTNTKIGLSRHDLCAPNILTLLVYQALVPILCPKCSLSTEIASEKNETISQYVRYVTELELDASILKWRKPGGCPHCKARGTVGLTVVAEMLIPDEDWLKVTRESKDAEAVAVYRSQSDRNLESSDMTGKTVFEHTLYKALQGGVDVRQCSRFEIFERYVRGHRARKNPNY